MLKRARALLGAVWRRWWLVYAALLIASHLVILFLNPQIESPANDPPGATRLWVQTPRMADAGPVAAPAPGEPVRISALRWDPPAPVPGAVPVILLHGSPASGATDYRRLAPLIARSGRTVFAIDFPGFGRSDDWVPSYSFLTNARYTLAFMDALSIERAHLLGWSQSGGTVVDIAHDRPDRVASMTLLAAIGAQEAEGSGDYHFEHAKYAVGYGIFVVLPELVPHFGLLGSRAGRHAFIRNFWDSDQRPLRALLERVTTPTLILHGRRDILVSAWGAELHHSLIPTSRLVILDANHFLPFLQHEESAAHLVPFFARHDAPGVPPLIGEADFAPTAGVERKVGPFRIGHATPWWLLVALIVLATFISEDATVIAVGLLIAAGEIDLSVGLLGCIIGIGVGDALLWAIGRFAGRRALHWPFLRDWLPERALEQWGRSFDKHAVKAVFVARFVPGTRLPMYLAAGLLSQRAHRFLLWAGVAVIAWTPLLLLVSALLGPPIHSFFEGALGGPLALIAALIVVFLGIRTLSLAMTRAGRLRLAAGWRKPLRSEFWPPWIFYLPLGPVLAWLALRHKGPMTFTCINPGVPNGGGVVGESKHQIMSALERVGAAEWLVRTELIDAGPPPAARADHAARLVAADARFGGWPVVLKPDEAQRGHGFRLIQSRDDAAAYFEDMTRPAIVQRYHPGPEECGILWARTPGAGPAGRGHIFSITRKVFPIIVGDGKRTLEELIWSSPRCRMQAATFLKRFAGRLDLVPENDEVVRLAIAGNHCQGTMFLDGADLITPALSARIDAIARSFPGGGFDFGRFDARYTTDDDLRRGEGFSIVELNGAMSESTNLYDPGRSVWWSYGVLFRQWKLMYELGAERRRAGVRPMTPHELIHSIRDHFKGRPGSDVAD